MLLKKIIKIKLLEWALDVLFSKLHSNFNNINILKEGDTFRKVVYNNSKDDWRGTYYNCKISKLEHNGKSARLEFTSQEIISGNNSSFYEGSDYVWEPVDMLEFYK